MKTWGKNDDKKAEHDKYRTLGYVAWGLNDDCRSWSADNDRDGFVPEDVARRKLAQHARGSRLPKIAKELCDAEIWEAVDGGWMIHDFLDYHLSKEEKQARRRREAVRKQESRDAARTAGREDVRGSQEDRRRIAGGSQEDRSFGVDAAGQTYLSVPKEEEEENSKTLTRLPVARTSRRPMIAPKPDSADGLVLAYIEHYEKITGGVFPEDTRTKLRQVFSRLLGGGENPDAIRAAFAWWDGFAPATFPSAINRMRLAGRTTDGRGGMSTADERVAAGLALVAKYEMEEARKEIQG